MARRNPWNESFYDCFDDCGICCYGYCCSSCLFGSNAKKINGSNCCIMCCIHCCLAQTGLSWIPHYIMREKLRRLYNIEEDESCTDIPATICCSTCALCQEAREMKSRGHNEFVRTNARRTGPIDRKAVSTEQPRRHLYRSTRY